VDRRLHLVSHLVVPNPNYAITRLLLSVENSDDITGLEINIEAGQQRSRQADVARVSFLKKALSLGINTPNQQWKIDWLARLATTVKRAKDVHGSSLTLAPPLCKVKVT
jgi:hypothetical protein